MGNAEYGWPMRAEGNGMVPMMVMVPGQQPGLPQASPPGPAPLDRLYNEAMARFDAFCFWYARPPRTPKGLREVAHRLETYGSPEALRIAEDLRQALAEAGA